MNQAPNNLGGPPEKIPQNAPADPVFKKARVGLNTTKDIDNAKHVYCLQMRIKRVRRAHWSHSLFR